MGGKHAELATSISQVFFPIQNESNIRNTHRETERHSIPYTISCINVRFSCSLVLGRNYPSLPLLFQIKWLHQRPVSLVQATTTVWIDAFLPILLWVHKGKISRMRDSGWMKKKRKLKTKPGSYFQWRNIRLCLPCWKTKHFLFTLKPWSHLPFSLSAFLSYWSLPDTCDFLTPPFPSS